MSSINNDILSKLAKFGRLLQKDYQKNSVIKRRNYSKKGVPLQWKNNIFI